MMKYASWVAIIAMGISGAVHIRIAPEHLEHTFAHGLFFGLVGFAQVIWTAMNFWTRKYRAGFPLWSGLLLSGGVMVVWALSRLVSTPFSSDIHPSDWSTLATKCAEFATFVALVASASAANRQTGWRRKSYLKILATIAGGGTAVWLIGMLLAPQLPSLSDGLGHNHAVLPVATVLSTSAYFGIVNSGRDEDALISVSSDQVDQISLHQTTIDADDVARMRGLDEIVLKPHVRVDFSPVGKHVMLEGLSRELYEGDQVILTLRFASGRELPVEFEVSALEPEAGANFLAADGFQITNAWIRATTFNDGLVAINSGDYEWRLPPGFPLPRVPENNPMTEEKVELGRYLFYDPRLSGNGTMSCSSCHLQELAFTDGVPRPVGSTGELHPRNSMTLGNSAYSATLTWANPTLLTVERQIPIPLFGEHPIEMGITGNEERVLERFRQDARYQALFANAYPDQPEPFTFNNITFALASFNRTLISGDSAYDLYLRGNRSALSESQKRGMEMFFSESLECHHCHTGFNMTLSTITANSTFEERPFFNTGLYNIGGTGDYPADNTGIYEITNNPADMGRFRPPSLRNVALTAPYMHDGSISTLTEVIAFYADGGRMISEGEYAGDGRANPYKNGFVSGFTLSETEIADLVAYLESLTDESFITDPRFSNPFTGTIPPQNADD